MALRPWLAALVLLAPVACRPPARAQADEARTLEHQGVERRYLLRLPAVATPGPKPLVIALHGFTQPVESLRAWLRLDPVADREGFAVAYPEAIEGRWSYPQGGGVLLPGRDAEEVDDVGFLDALLDALAAEGVADPARAYVAGNSRGALMTWALACRRPERFAAAAPLSSGMREAQLASCSPARPVPIVAMAGTADPVQRYDGWLGPPPLTRLLSVPETMEFWRRLHGCDGQTARWLPHREPDDPTRTELVEWTGCASGGPVLLYRVVGGGHQPPSFASNTDEQRRRFGRRGQDVEAAEEIWRAFQRSGPAGAR